MNNILPQHKYYFLFTLICCTALGILKYFLFYPYTLYIRWVGWASIILLVGLYIVRKYFAVFLYWWWNYQNKKKQHTLQNLHEKFNALQVQFSNNELNKIQVEDQGDSLLDEELLLESFRTEVWHNRFVSFIRRNYILSLYQWNILYNYLGFIIAILLLLFTPFGQTFLDTMLFLCLVFSIIFGISYKVYESIVCRKQKTINFLLLYFHYTSVLLSALFSFYNVILHIYY